MEGGGRIVPDEEGAGEALGSSGGAVGPSAGSGGTAGLGRSPPPLPRIIRNKHRSAQVAPAPGRKLFDRGRRKVFLEWFAGTANLSLSARQAGVHYRTVLRHRATHKGFRADFEEALETGKVRVRAWLVQARDDGRTEYDPDAHAPANLTTGEALQLLRDDAQREAAVARASGSGGGGRASAGRMPTVASNDEVRSALIRALEAHGLRVRARQATGRAEGMGGDSLSGCSLSREQDRDSQ
jgi:hypothetical protein